MDQYNTMCENGDAGRGKVRHARARSPCLCTNHAIGTFGGKDERKQGEKAR
jgi:hypothetical protein